jgi:hypothetical protein
MSESVIDFAGLDSAAATTTETVETPSVETTETVETPTTETTTETTETKEAKPQYNSDGTPKEAVSTTAEDLPGTEKTPAEIRQSLKALRDLDPKHASAVKQLHGAFERFEAIKDIFPGGVNEVKQAKEFMDLVGGHEGLESLQGTKAAAEASDNQLYEGNAELISNIVEDLKSHNKLDALGKLAPSFLDAVKANDQDGYYKAFAPHFLSGLELVNIPGAFSGLEKALNDPDPAKAVAAAKGISADLTKWYKELDENNKKAKEAVVSPERKKLDEDRAAFLREQTDFKTKETTEFKNNVASVCEKHNNFSLGSQLKDFLRMPFFQGFGRENLMPLGNTIKATLYETLKSDNAYQAQMKSLWGAKTPDRAKIEEYHKARVDSIAADIVRSTVQRMYPGYAKGGAAAGRIAAKTAKTAVTAKVEATATAAGKPIYVATKPSRDALDMDHVDKHGKSDAIMEMIAGRGFLKGSGKWITWRK